MSIKDHVKGMSTFSHYCAGVCYYLTDSGLEFPIPIEDVEGATLLSEDRSMFFMRWIRKHLQNLENR